ncbi:hypothetical protein VOLCADRAFT_89771 [Volvox carteri f. nagariensis]|uniref:PWWP domain-containing protein n=1 Tax=Volvox carteri f. nagariensis TaxID=3068 RepID=D8TSL1_VOLCA|nr:uncharacterized protein VOLCADRAFT_89771 [Volvox carteri f. nagariensis]EFJ49391.1 hypothetical protein VOLCADRAFT_89771 [Volvox carteri f. nagariensis]|eukprot:XP_002949372.1 hypothetical protein VOLCADRAFT_89771 [Volvox carteri f. nagariensis]
MRDYKLREGFRNDHLSREATPLTGRRTTEGPVDCISQQMQLLCGQMETSLSNPPPSLSLPTQQVKPPPQLAPATANGSCESAGGMAAGTAAAVGAVMSSGMALYLQLVAEAAAAGGGVGSRGGSRGGGGEQQRPAEGSRVWIKMAGYCHWPAVVFSLRYCRKSEVPDLLASYQPGRTLVHFYGTVQQMTPGSHDHVWATQASLSSWTTEREVRLAALKAAARSSKVAAATLAELSGSLGANAASDRGRELERVVQMREVALGQPLGGKGGGGNSGGGGGGGGGRKGGKAQCGGCRESGTQVTCASCRTGFHTLCLPQPDLSPAHMLATAALLSAATTEQTAQPHPIQQQQQRQHLVVAVWICGVCGKQNELKGPVPASVAHRTAAPPREGGGGGAPRGGGRPPGGGWRAGDAAGGASGACGAGTGTGTGTGTGSGGADLSPNSPQLPQPQQQPQVPQHAELLALYEQLVAEDEALEASVAAAAAEAPAIPARDIVQLQPPAAAAAMGATTSAAATAVAVAASSSSSGAVPGGQGSRPPPGTRLWVKTPGYCHWPAVVFSLRYCRKSEVPDLLASYQPGCTLVHFYGEHNHMWLPAEEVALLAAAAADPREEQERREGLMLRLLHPALQQSVVTPGPVWGGAARREVVRVVALREARMAAEEERREQEAWELLLTGAREGAAATAGPPGGGRRGGGGGAPGGSSGAGFGGAGGGRDRDGLGMRAAGGGGEGGVGGWRSRLRVCAACEEPGGQVSCPHCRRAYHTLCLTPRWLSPAFMPPHHPWTCANCGSENEAPQGPQSSGGNQDGSLEAERMGLTPDWIIMAAAFKVFQLPRPTASAPYIRGLLDPCTNSKANPNIPAEKLYDKSDDGLKLSNSWSGYHVILNPEYTSQTQWRFVNRAIDEVENGCVPAVLLLCRNSTDTAYFQRLRPYPRVMLKRTSARFKDYEKTPIGFGIAVFCIAPRGPGRTTLYRRFIDAFGDWGEPNIPIDAAFVSSPAFSELLDRLADHTTRHMRDTWVQCSACRKWRIVPYEVYRLLEDQQRQQQPQLQLQLQDQPHQVASQEEEREAERREGSRDAGTGDDTPPPSAGVPGLGPVPGPGIEAAEAAGGAGAGAGGREAERARAVDRRPLLAGSWTCAQLGSGSGCYRPQSRVEAAGVHYARQRGAPRPPGAHRAAGAGPVDQHQHQHQHQHQRRWRHCPEGGLKGLPGSLVSRL